MKLAHKKKARAKRPKSTPSYSVPALDKALDVIEWLAKSSIPQSQTELARTLRRTPSKIFRTLVALEQRGYIAKDAISGKYHLTLKLFTIAHSHSPVDSLIRAARLPMQSLAERTLQSCHLAILHGTDILVIANELAPAPLRLSVEVGGVVPAQKTSSGPLLAALLPDDEYRVRFGDAMPDADNIRKRGWISEASLQVQGVRNIAVPVQIPGGYAALSIPWIGLHNDDESEAALLKACRDTAKAITATLQVN